MIVFGGEGHGEYRGCTEMHREPNPGWLHSVDYVQLCPNAVFLCLSPLQLLDSLVGGINGRSRAGKHRENGIL